MERFLNDSSDNGSNNANLVDVEPDEGKPSKRARYGQSTVWNYFNKSSDGKSAKCIKCGKMYQTSGNTTNLSGHLKRMHPTLTVSELPKATSSNLSFVEKKYEASSSRKKTLDSALTYYISSDLRPFSVVENKGFRHFVNTLDPRYELPSRTTLRNVCMTNLFNEMKAKLSVILNEVDNCAVTTDCWTSRANESYLTVTCHFIENFELRTAVLSIKKLLDETNHSAENISCSLRDVMIDWRVFDKVTTIVTDNARNMIKACEILQNRHVPCFAHSINLTVQDCLSIDKIKAVVAKCKRIVAYFKSSTIAYAKLKEAQETDNPYSLKQECLTRWNTAYYMIERILLTKVAIQKVLLNTPKAPMPLSADEIFVLEDLKQLFLPFEHATLHTSSSTLVTVSKIIQSTCGFLHNLESLKEKLSTQEGREACNNLVDGIKQRLLQYEKRSVTRVSTLLDPRFKREGFFSVFNASDANKFLESELSSLNSTLPRTSLSAATCLPTPTTTNNQPTTQPPLFEFLEKNKSQRIRNSRVDSILTLRQYFNEENLEASLNPLDYWKISNNKTLQKCIQKYLCVPATSIESERMFSKTGLIVSEKRSSLKSKHVDMLIFTNRNEWMLSK